MVRKKAAEKLYLFLLGLEDPSLLNLDSENLDNVSIILTDTNWAEAISEIKDQRNLIASMLNITLDNLIKTKAHK